MSKTNAELKKESDSFKLQLMEQMERNRILSDSWTILNEKYKQSISANQVLINDLEKERQYNKKITSFIGKRVVDAGKPKQLHINLEAICLDNGITNPESMTIIETKKILFCLSNLFNDAKGYAQ